MKIEKIDDNSIKCTLSSLDLSSRNLNLRDMTYGSQAAKRLFQEMMQKAQAEVGFTTDNTPLMIEAIPLQGGAIQLIISKVEDPEELDTRFSRFSQNAGGSENGWISQLASQILEGAQDLIKNLKVGELTEEDEPEEEVKAPEELIRIFLFGSLDRVCGAAVALGGAYQGENTLYKDEKNHRYYLVLRAEEENAESLARVANLLSEYGQKIPGDALNEAYYEEHMEALLREKALQKLSLI